MDDPYQTPASALTERGDPTEPLSRLEEGIVDFMAASRVRTIVFIALASIGCFVSLAGIAEALLGGTLARRYGLIGDAVRAVIWGGVLFHCALAAVSLWRYLGAVNRVARSYDRRDLDLALRRRRFARVGWFVMIALFIFSLFVPMLYAG